jgi:protein-S-isoprenylcysteine O-methyltransferase Ste14
MALNVPSFRVVVIVFISIAVFMILPALAWGSWSGLRSDPARAGALLVLVAASLTMLVSGANLGGRPRGPVPVGWIILGLAGFTLLFVWVPPFLDARDIATLDGDASRYLGLVIFTVGCILRVGSMFALGSRFRAPWMTQDEHRLVTTGWYRYIRNPSYLGAILGMVGWFLVFRCGVGLIFCSLLVPLLVHWIRREESLMLDEFGEEYASYRRRTWMLPFIR